MGININQGTPSSFLPTSMSSYKPPVNIDTKSKSNKTDLCSSSIFKGLPDIDIPSFKLDLNINGDFLPDFTKFKISNLKLHGLDLPFKCSLKSMSLPFGKSLSYKSDFKKLNNVDCKDTSGGINNDKFKNKYLKNALNVGNCSKEVAQATLDAADDLNTLNAIPNSDNLKMAKTVASSIVDNKLDMTTAASLLGGSNSVNLLTEAVSTSGTPLDKIMKLGKGTNLIKDKESIIDYANKISNTKTMSNFGSSPMTALADNATKDSNNNVTSIPTNKSVSNSQRLSLFSKAKNLAKNNPSFLNKIKRIA